MVEEATIFFVFFEVPEVDDPNLVVFWPIAPKVLKHDKAPQKLSDNSITKWPK